MSEPTEADLNAAIRLSRVHVYEGGEPYAPSVMPFARMLAAHRLELEAVHEAELQKHHAKLVDVADKLAAVRTDFAALQRELAAHRAEVQAMAAELRR